MLFLVKVMKYIFLFSRHYIILTCATDVSISEEHLLQIRSPILVATAVMNFKKLCIFHQFNIMSKPKKKHHICSCNLQIFCSVQNHYKYHIYLAHLFFLRHQNCLPLSLRNLDATVYRTFSCDKGVHLGNICLYFLGVYLTFLVLQIIH